MLTKENNAILKDEIEKEGAEQQVDMALLREMIEAGLFYGRKKTKTYPTMKPFIFINRSGIEIIDLVKTMAALKEATDFIKNKIKAGGKILLIGVQPSAKELIKETAEKFDFSYVNERWIGGTLTNFEVISKRVDYFKDLKIKREKNEFEKYTKKERLNIDREIERMEKIFSGIKNMEKVPEMIFVININLHKTAVREAKRLKIPIIGIVNTDANPDLIDYPIPANDNAKSAIKWILEKIKDAIEEGGRELAKLAVEKKEE